MHVEQAYPTCIACQVGIDRLSGGGAHWLAPSAQATGPWSPRQGIPVSDPPKPGVPTPPRDAPSSPHGSQGAVREDRLVGTALRRRFDSPDGAFTLCELTLGHDPPAISAQGG